MTPEQTLDWLAQQHWDQCREDRPIQDWIRKMKSQLPAQTALCKYGQEPKSCTSNPMDCQCAIDATFEQPEQEQIAVWLEKDCDEQYLADRVRAGDYAKEKGHMVFSQCALVTDDVGDHQSPHFRKELDVDDSTSQQKQEPMAFLTNRRQRLNVEFNATGLTLMPKSVDWKIPLYTTPPQRTWVGLTDEEINEWTPEIHVVIRSIEAKLKEKNT